ncbi:MAG: YfdX family protein [Gammaproteobacteria bacterium]
MKSQLQNAGLSILVAAGLLLGCYVTVEAAASTASVVTTPTKMDPQAQALARFSDDGERAMRAIRGSRFAIFKGQPKLAVDLMNQADTALKAAVKDAPSFDVSTTMKVQGKTLNTNKVKDQKARLVPFDTQITVAEDYMDSPAKKAHVAKANTHLAKGEKQQAIDELRLGDIDVNYQRSWLPIGVAEKHLEQALKMAADQKYYEANLALKAIEDSVTYDSVNSLDTPAS